MKPHLSAQDTDRVEHLLKVGILTGAEREELENYIEDMEEILWDAEYGNDDESEEANHTLRRINSILQNHIGVV